MNSVLTVVCPECQVIYRIDPSRVPPGGLRARCTSCGAVIAIGLAMPPFVASAAPMDPAVVAASDAAAAPVRTDAWDWGAAEPGSGAASIRARRLTIRGTGAPRGAPRVQRPCRQRRWMIRGWASGVRAIPPLGLLSRPGLPALSMPIRRVRPPRLARSLPRSLGAHVPDSPVGAIGDPDPVSYADGRPRIAAFPPERPSPPGRAPEVPLTSIASANA